MASDWATFERSSLQTALPAGQPTKFQEYGIALLSNILQGASEVNTSEIAEKILESGQRFEDAWWDFKNLLFSAAMSTSDNAAHERLVGLLFASANHKGAEDAGDKRKEVDGLLGGLYGFGWAARDMWNGPNNFVPIYGSKEAAQHAWVNLNRFFAHISHQQRLTPIPQLKDWIEDYGLWNISDGLEVADLEAIRENGESAAVWLEIAGRDIYKDGKWGKRDGKPEEGIPKRGNELWDAYLKEGGVYEGRWDFWRQRLLEIAGEEGLDRQIREATEKAARVMGEIEGGS